MRFDKTLERQVVGIYVSDHLTYECAFHFGCSSWNSCDNSSSRSPTMNNPSLFCTPGPPSTWCGLIASSPKTIASSTSASLKRKFLEDAESALEEARQRSGVGRDGTLQIAHRRNLPENVVWASPRRPHHTGHSNTEAHRQWPTPAPSSWASHRLHRMLPPHLQCAMPQRVVTGALEEVNGRIRRRVRLTLCQFGCRWAQPWTSIPLDFC